MLSFRVSMKNDEVAIAPENIQRVTRIELNGGDNLIYWASTVKTILISRPNVIIITAPTVTINLIFELYLLSNPSHHSFVDDNIDDVSKGNPSNNMIDATLSEVLNLLIL